MSSLEWLRAPRVRRRVRQSRRHVPPGRWTNSPYQARWTRRSRRCNAGSGEPTIARLRIAEEDVAITLVPTLGRWMQEHWRLATGGPLAQYFEARGLDRPDDMAAVILTSLWRTLHYRSIRLDEQIAWYRATRGTVR